jgi:thymidylate synthase ThyX
MKHEKRIYLLDPQKISPETIAVTFAKTSRSPESFDQIAAELNEQKSAEFNEKWVVGYGHSSVAEHAVLHVAVENVSRLAVECLESNRLASYTEKSTRYQTWDAEAFHIPEELSNHKLRDEYTTTCSTLFGVYEQLIPVIKSVIENENPRKQDETENAWKRRTLSLTIDNCRFLLPAASLANVGLTINARALEHAISKMLTSPLIEVQKMGAEIKENAIESVPTLLKYAREIHYLKEVENLVTNKPTQPLIKGTDWCQLVHFDIDGVDRILASVLYRYHQFDYAQSLEAAKQLAPAHREKLLKQLLVERDKFTIPIRELEHSSFTFDILLDQGAYYEVKRHRMLTLTPQELSTNLGYAIPKAISTAGMLEPFTYAMEKAAEVYGKIVKGFPAVAPYIVPNGYNRRFLVTLNLRSALHFISLRSALNAHFSVRRLAQRMADEIGNALPELAPFILKCEQENASSIEQTYFHQV